MNTFMDDILAGFSAEPKYIPSKYFYNEKGSKLFQDIMNLPEYYLTHAEADILTRYGSDILHTVNGTGENFDLIELGAGDGYKTRILIRQFLKENANFHYSPIDISEEAINSLVIPFKNEFPSLEMTPIRDDYLHALDVLHEVEHMKKVILFLGANIGNFLHHEAVEFLSAIRNRITPGDLVLIGFDLKKDPQIILNAYNDQSGVTREFNLNLIDRIAEELHADISRNDFDFYPTYSPDNGEVRSYLISLIPQTVHIPHVDRTFHFSQWEPVFTEVSKKYSLDEIDQLAGECGFEVFCNWPDSKHQFIDSLWKAI